MDSDDDDLYNLNFAAAYAKNSKKMLTELAATNFNDSFGDFLNDSESANESIICIEPTTKPASTKSKQIQKETVKESPEDEIAVPAGPRRSKRLSNDHKKSSTNNPSNLNTTTKGSKSRTRNSKTKSSVTAATQEILISSDSEIEEVMNVNEDKYDDINCEQTVLVRWRFTKVHRIVLRKFQPFSYILDYFAELENISPDLIMLTLNSRKLNPEDSIDTTNITIIDIIDATLLSTPDKKIGSGKGSIKNNANTLTFKIQIENKKKPIMVCIKKTDCMNVLMEKVREELKLSLDKMSFKFDGDVLNPNQTPEQQDVEDGGLIDVIIKA